MPPVPRSGTIDEIYTAMKEMEQAYIPGATGETDFAAHKDMPPAIGTYDLQYPFSFRFPPRVRVDWHRMNRGSEQELKYEIPVTVLVARSTNQFGALSQEARRFVLPMIALYVANPSIKGTVRSFQMGEISFGDLTINAVKHYGVQFPIIISQSVKLPAAPTYTPA